MSYTLRALKNGECRVKDYITFGDEWSEDTRLYYLYIWLIEGGDRPVVVDTGPKDIKAFNTATAAYIPGGVTQSSDETTLGALAIAGVDPGDVSHVFITHTHPDHFGNYDLFPNATVIVNEHAFTKKPAPQDLAGRLLMVGDEEVLPGIRTVHIGVHSPDSQAILIDAARGTVVLCGDAAYHFENLEEDRPIRSDDIEAAREAVRKLKSLGDVVLPGHDPLILSRYPDGIIA